MSDWVSYRPTPWAEKLRFLIVFGWLALLALACELLLFLITGPHRVPGTVWETGPVIQGEVLRWFALFGPAAGFATIAGAIARNWLERPPHNYPGLKVGVGVTLLYAFIIAQTQL